MFWIVCAVIFVAVAVTGYMLLKDIRQDNEDLRLENKNKLVEIQNIEKAMNNETLPNKVWPQTYLDRYNAYLEKEQELNMKLEAYNMRLKQAFPNVQKGLFDTVFKRKWIGLLTALLNDGFVVADSSISPSNVQEKFETGQLSRQLGVPMPWVSGKMVYTPSAKQRRTAEQQYWIQERIIEHFRTAEKTNGTWSSYRYKRKDSAGATGRSGRDEVSPPAFLSIVFEPHALKTRRSHRPAGPRAGVETAEYVFLKPHFTEYHFTCKLKIRFSSIPSFINRIVTDRDFFFLVDHFDVSSVSYQGDDKPGRDAKAGFTPESEPPVNIILKARVLEFDFSTHAAGASDRGPDLSRNAAGSYGSPQGGIEQ